MARRRIIDPKFWTDPLNGRVVMPARLLYIGIWNHADDAGILPNDAAWLRAAIFPHDRRIREADVRTWLAELEHLGDPGRLLAYEFEGRRLYLVTRFHEHQAINRPTSSTLPRPPEDLLELLSADSRAKVEARTAKPSLLAAQRAAEARRQSLSDPHPDGIKGASAGVKHTESDVSRHATPPSVRPLESEGRGDKGGTTEAVVSVLKTAQESRRAHGGLSEGSVSLTAKGSEVKGSEVNARARAEQIKTSEGRGGCRRDGCGHGWVTHRGPGDPEYRGERVCVVAGCGCIGYAAAAVRDEDPFGAAEAHR